MRTAAKYYYMNQGGSPYNAEMQAVIARWTALTYVAPSDTVKTALNTLIAQFKTDGVWTGFDALWVPMLNDAALVSTTGAINLVSPSANQLTFPVAPTYTVSGFEGNAVDQYCLTNFNPSTQGVQYQRDSASRGYYKYIGGGGTSYLDGHVTSLSDVITGTTSSVLQRINSSTSLGAAISLAGSGYRALNRSGASAGSVYVDTTKTDFTTASVARVNENLTILRANPGYGSMGIAFAFYGRSFSQAEHALIRTAFLNYKTAIGL